MGRARRIVNAGETFHVYGRCARGADMCEDDADRTMMLRVMAYVLSRIEVQLRAFCLMGNHFHAMVTCVEPRLSAFMRDFLSIYVREFNLRHGYDGPMFRDRFQSRLVDSEAYDRTLSLYIHRNPIDLGWGEQLGSYPWSSLRYHLDPSASPWWLSPDRTLESFGGVAAYAAAIERPAKFRLGPEATPEEVYGAWAITVLDDICSALEAATGCDPKLLRCSDRVHRSDERKIAILLAREVTDLPLATLAEHFGFANRSGLARSVRSTRSELLRRPDLASLRTQVLKQVHP